MARFAQRQVVRASSTITPSAAVAEATEKKQFLFRITRTHTNNVPVYLSYAGGARRVPMTELRRIEGNVEQCQTEIQRLVGAHVNVRRADNKLFVTGNFVSKVRKHVTDMGF